MDTQMGSSNAHKSGRFKELSEDVAKTIAAKSLQVIQEV